jgi:nicotinate-nucleotide adenylyltransferase
VARRRLLFGGTFDPPHRAHVELPRLAAAAVGATEVVYVPAGRNPLKPAGHQSTPEHRLRMLELALAGRPNVRIATVELDRGGPSWWVDTLELMVESGEPGDRLLFLIGADHALDFHRWHEWERILELATPVVMARPPLDAASLASELRHRYESDEAAWWGRRIVELPSVDVSATEVRRRIAAGEPVDDMVAPAVARYAREHGLYADEGRD